MIILILLLLFFIPPAYPAVITIKCENPDKQIFLDGMPFSKTPVDSSVNVQAGYHFVSFFNHEMNRIDIPIDYKKGIHKIVELATESFYMENSDSIHVNLEWEAIEKEFFDFKMRRQFALITSWGFIFIASIMFTILTGF
ncbi:MAG: hypothetical protein KAI81_09435 [Candidatus Marinimicrobia bacterium]|nr:hypothetical protein [Candidatus Neomarinimicrobiota bacterium]